MKGTERYFSTNFHSETNNMVLPYLVPISCKVALCITPNHRDACMQIGLNSLFHHSFVKLFSFIKLFYKSHSRDNGAVTNSGCLVPILTNTFKCFKRLLMKSLFSIPIHEHIQRQWCWSDA